MSGGGNLNSVFYAGSYHPIQAGSIDGTDIVPHDNAVYRAHLCSSAGLYDPFGDPKVIGDPYCTLFVGRLSHFTTENTLHKVMSKYGHVKNLRLVRHIVTGASRGYAFVEFESERDMRRAYKNAHHSFIDDSEIIVDYNRQQLMPGWIPRRLGGGLSGRKESGQLRFGGRERPFRAPIRDIPFNELKKLGIPPPPQGRYMSRFQVPSPPRREKSSLQREKDYDSSSHARSRNEDRDEHVLRRSSVDEEAPYDDLSFEEDERSHKRQYDSMETDERYARYEPREEHTHRSSRYEDHRSSGRKSFDLKKDNDERERKRSRSEKRESSMDIDEHAYKRDSQDRKDQYRKHHRHRSEHHRHEEMRSTSQRHSSDQ